MAHNIKTNSDHHFNTTTTVVTGTPAKKMMDKMEGDFANLKKGALHKELDVPEDKNIPVAKIDKATKSNNPLLRKRAQFAKNMRKK